MLYRWSTISRMSTAVASLSAAVAPDREAARLTRLRARYPRWIIWYSRFGWQARRRGSFRQLQGPGSAPYVLFEPTARRLGKRLAAEDARELPAEVWQP